MSTINRNAHGLTAGQRIVLNDLVGGAPLTEEFPYYVLAAGLTANTFQIAETDGGTALTFANITSANMQVVPADDTSPDAVYVAITDPVDVMAPPTTVPTPSVPTLTSAVVSGVVRLRIDLTGTAEAKVRAWEVNVTHKFIGAAADWSTPLVLTVPEGATDASIPALGGTVYAVRVRTQDVFGNFSAYCADTTITTEVGSDSLNASLALLANDVQDGIITETKIADNSISTPKLQAGAVTADILAATIVLASLIQTSASGRRIEIDIFGIRLYDASDTLLVNIPTNGDPVYVKGAIDADSLISETSASFRTAASLEGAAVMTLQNGVATPSNVPPVTASVDVLTLTSTPVGMVGAAGIAYDSAAGSFWLAADPSEGGYVAHEYNATTGVKIRSIAATGSTSTVTDTVGSTSHVSDFSRAFVGSTNSHFATAITIPAGLANVKITKVAVYMAGYLGSCSTRNGVWDDVVGTGHLARESATYTAASGGDVGNGNSDLHNQTLTSPLGVSAGSTYYIGYRRMNTSDGSQHDLDQGASKTTKSGDGTGDDGTGWATYSSSEKINAYATYTYDVDTRLETAPNVGIATDGTYIYTLDDTGVVWKYLRADGSYVAKSGVQTAITGSKLSAGMFYDATAAELIITTFTGSGAGVFPKFVRVNTSTLAVSASVYSASAGTTFNGTNDTVRGGARLNDPLNASAATYWIATTSKVYAYTFSGSAATQTSNRDFGLIGTVGTGLTHDGTIFRGYSAITPTKVWKFTAWDWTSASAIYWFCYAWYDDAATAVTGGTAAAATDLITKASHGLSVGNKVQFTTLTGGTGLSLATDYYVIAAGFTTGVFSVSTTPGGAAVNITVDYSAVSFRTIYETAVSPRTSLTLRRRERVQVINAAIPAGGAADPNKVRIYIKPNATDPGVANFKRQVTDALTARYLTDYNSAGGADGEGTAFPSGTPAELKSSATGWSLKGDGTISGLQPIVRVYTSGANTWTKPAGIHHITVEVQGGGGGGGGVAAVNTAGSARVSGGGGAGGYTRKTFTSADLASLTTATATVGAGGAGNSGAAGSGGTSSTFAGTGISTMTGNGGNGCPASVAERIIPTGDPSDGGGGAASGGDINIYGAYGRTGHVMASSQQAGHGGDSFLGPGGEGFSVSTTAATSGAGSAPAGGYGGGGGGASGAGTSNAARAGGAGAAGVIIVTEYYAP